ncbi:beta-xylosidase [Paenibacillus endophyticus]|uniref:Beta-xylosidase n=1 Tax=Paenibacillus endophyticus TaxID=1294268 RepID=A0A7W5GCS5_9BACL|nr:glycoside hydrolase family 43 protein [Paenibacillus endophyticus]MBB3155709.1 beta-xylosidase [Paenibacillus endophyticus]
MVHRKDIRVRDPFIFVDKQHKCYYLYGTTDQNVWSGPGTGFDTYRSTDLEKWEGPIPAFRPEPGFWADHHFWAPEVYSYNGSYYMFASFKSEDKRRATQVLIADGPAGPYKPLSSKPVTPAEWECLDGTLHIDESGKPWMVFCQEWVQVRDGKMCAVPLTLDLQEAIGEPITLFSASEAPWAVAGGDNKDVYVTDGPFLFKNEAGDLLMLWSSGSKNGYAIGIARSNSGCIEGPWTQDEETLFPEDGGHGMLFRTLDDRLMLTMHTPNNQPDERAVFIEVEEQRGTLRRKT